MPNSLCVLDSLLLAHAVLNGAGEFLNGLVHSLSSPVNLLLLGALGLVLARSRPLRVGQPVRAFFAGLIVGGVFAIAVAPPHLAPTILSVFTLLLALSVVGWLPLNAAARSGLAGIAGAILAANTIEPPFSVQGTAGAFLGLTLTATAIAYYVSLRPNRPWADIGIRVLAAWMAAISMLLVAMSLRR